MGTDIKFANNFKKFRKLKGISQKEFAQKLYEHTGKMLTLTSVSNYETGLHMPPPQVLPFIARILEVSLDALFGTNTTEDVVERYTEEEENAFQVWKQELQTLEKDFYKLKIRQSKTMSDAALATLDCCEKLLKVAKKQQDELLILQTELSTVREMFSLFRK